MLVYRADETSAAQFVRMLSRHGVGPVRIERYPFDAVYVVVGVNDPQVAALARSIGPAIHRVPTLKELESRDQ